MLADAARSEVHHLPQHLLEKLGTIASEERYGRHDVLFNEGDPGDSLFLVVEGTALIQKVLSKEAGTYKDLGVAEAGEIFGEMALFDSLPRSATVRATASLTVLRITRDDFDGFLDADKASAKIILGGIISILSNRLRESSQHTATLFETGNTIASILDMDEMARRIMERLLAAIFHVDAGVFCLWNPYMDDCDVLFSRGVPTDQEDVLRISRTGPIAGFLKYNRTPFTMTDLDPDHPLRLVFSLETNDSLLIGPLMHRDDLLGFIILVGREEGFSSFHRILLSAVCSQVATAVVNQEYAKDAAARSRLESKREQTRAGL